MGQKTCLNPDNGFECAREYGKETRAAKIAAENETLVKAYKENTKKLPEYKADLQDLINKIVRLIDFGHPSMSDGLTDYEVHAGHLISRGSDDTLRYHLFNIWAQSSSDNTHKGGNPIGMRENLKKTFGNWIIEEIDTLKARFPVLKLSKADIIERKFLAAKIIKELELVARKYTTEERISLRIEIMRRLDLYQNAA